MTRAPLLFLLLLIPGCVTGTRESAFNRPGGEILTLSLENGPEVTGELLSARPEGLLLRTSGIFQFPWGEIESASLDRLRGIGWPERTMPDAATLERLRVVSRFPQGLDEATTRRLLDAYGQDRLQECRVVEERLACEAVP
jgi:hypothetical protein